jgi:hypothetical protein
MGLLRNYVILLLRKCLKMNDYCGIYTRNAIKTYGERPIYLQNRLKMFHVKQSIYEKY